jgi:processive 1,2-diacylglycerol beta-glucosyltransferase
MIYGVWNVLYSDPAALLNRLVELDRPAVVQQTTESQKITVNDASTYSHLTTTKLEQVLRRARIWFWIVVVLHIIPLYFIYINGVPTLRRWNSIHQLKRSDLLFDDLSNHSAPKEGLPKSIQLYDKATGRMLGPITSQQLEFLIEQLEEEHAGDRDYYLQRDMLDTLERQGADPKLMHLLRAAMRKSGEIEIEWRDESQKGTNDE